MISRLPKEDDDYADALDVYIHFITDPGLWACHTGFIPEGGRLLEQAYNEVGHGNLYIFSNMPEELFVALRDKFPDSLGRLPDDNILISSRMGVRKPEDGAFKRLKDAAGGDTLLIDDQLINVVRAEECGLGGRLFLADSEAAAAEIIE
jgi:FMN phosphatase YigB (HAD superfamily)